MILSREAVLLFLDFVDWDFNIIVAPTLNWLCTVSIVISCFISVSTNLKIINHLLKQRTWKWKMRYGLFLPFTSVCLRISFLLNKSAHLSGWLDGYWGSSRIVYAQPFSQKGLPWLCLSVKSLGLLRESLCSSCRHTFSNFAFSGGPVISGAFFLLISFFYLDNSMCQIIGNLKNIGCIQLIYSF